MKRGGGAGVVLVLARGDAAELLDLLEEVLDQMAPFVHLLIVGDGAGAAGVREDHGERAALVQGGSQGVAVEGLVGDQGVEVEPRDQRRDTDAVVALAGQEHEAHQIAQRVDQSHDLGGQAAARAADGLISSPPFAPPPWRWTLTMVPSISAYSKSGTSASSVNPRSNTPFSAQRRKRFPPAPHLPKPPGRSRHATPASTPPHPPP